MPPSNRLMGGASGKKLLREAIIAGRFGIVGVAATTVHIVAVSLLLSETQLPTLLANACAFILAFGVSFGGNYIWTFQLPGQPWKAMRRFLIISVSAFCANTVILAAILNAGWFSATVAAVFSAAIVPVITFIASRLWGFQLDGKDRVTRNNP